MLYEIKKKSDLDQIYIPIRKQIKYGIGLRQFLLNSYLFSNSAKFFVINFHIKEVGKSLFVEMTYHGAKFNPYKDLPHPDLSVDKRTIIGGNGKRLFWCMVDASIFHDFTYSYSKDLNKLSFIWDRQKNLELPNKHIFLSSIEADFNVRIQLNSHGGNREFGAYYLNDIIKSNIKSRCILNGDNIEFAPHQYVLSELMYNVVYYSKPYIPVLYNITKDFIICYPNVPIEECNKRNMVKFHECKFIGNKIVYKWR